MSDYAADWLPAHEAAAALGCSPSHIAWLVARGHLVAEMRGRARWMSRDSVDALTAERAASGWTYWSLDGYGTLEELEALLGSPA